MEQKPKPQRKRKSNKEKVDVNIRVKNAKSSPPAKVKTKTGLERVIVTSTPSQERRQLRRLQKQVGRLQKKQNGPKVQDVMSTTLTLGSITGNSGGGLERAFRVWLSPILLKPHDSEGATTPMTIRASQYDLWRVTHVKITLQPLIGSSVVTGTVILVDLDQEGSAAKPETVDTIKARPHTSVSIGTHRTWTIPARYLAGPREGWWYCDTNEDPSQSLGPALNVRTYMQTMNVLGATASKATTTYAGPLFLMEMKVSYQFANYNPKPALSSLQTLADDHLDTGEASFENDENGALLLKVNQNSQLAARTSREAPTTKDSLSETIWSIAGGAVEGIASALGAWGWLLKGGWWVVRRIFGKTTVRVKGMLMQADETSVYFACYASVEDARSNQPIIQKLNGNGSVQIPAGYYFARQLNEPNLNSPTHSTVVVKSGRITPAPEPEPTEPEEWLPLGRLKDYNEPLPAMYTWVPQAGGGKGVIYNGIWDISGPARNARWTLTGIPVITKYSLIKQEDSSPRYADVVLKATSGKFNTDSFRVPGDTGTEASQNWWWLDLTYTGVFLTHYKQSEKAYARQGVIHTASTLIQAMKATPDEWKEEGSFFFLDESQLASWHDLNYPIFQLCQEIGVDPADGNTSVTPVALFGDLNTTGLLIIDVYAQKSTQLVSDTGVCGILTCTQKWPGTNSMFDYTTKCMITATPVFQKSSYPSQKWFAMGPFEQKIIKVKGTAGPPPDQQNDEDEDFVRLKLEELKLLAEKLTDKEGKL